jgi:thiol-disulfide isomerase/thioredoxin
VVRRAAEFFLFPLPAGEKQMQIPVPSFSFFPGLLKPALPACFSPLQNTLRRIILLDRYFFIDNDGSMKKSIKLCSVALMLAGCGVAGMFSASADTPAPKAGEAAVSAVGKALEKADFLTKDRPNPKAKYYLFLYSASWCGPCCREMPHVVRTYRKIRQTDDVELVLFSCDKTEEAAKAWAKEERMKFPIVKPKKGNGIPGYKPGGSIPRLGIVDGTGKIIVTGHPATLLKDWRKYCKPEEGKK